MNCMVYIPTIARRLAFANRLSRRLGDLGFPVTVMEDTQRDLFLHHELCWRLAASFGNEWAGVIQDDVLLGADFAKRVQDAFDYADAHGFDVISLILWKDRKYAKLIDRDGNKLLRGRFEDAAYCVVEGKDFVGEQAVFIRSSFQPTLAESMHHTFPEKIHLQDHDRVMGHVLTELGKQILIPMPNPVEHNTLLERAQRRLGRRGKRHDHSRMSVLFK